MKHNTSFIIFTRNPSHREAITRKKVKFYNAIDIRNREKTITDVYLK